MATVTLKDVADHAGVTPSTASRALSRDKSSLVKASTRRRVLEAAEQLGYRGNSQASALRRGRSGTVGVIVADLSNPFISPVLRGIATALGGRDLLPIIAETRDSSGELTRVGERLLNHRVDGLITTAGRYRDRSFLKRLADELPTVLAVRDLPGSGIPAISHDDVAGGRMAANHLLSLGHTHVAQLMGPQDVWSFEGRAQGFQQATQVSGITSTDIRGSGYLPTVEEGHQLAVELLSRSDQPPTGIFAHNDTIAIGALAAFREHGIACPQRVSVVGYNDIPLTDRLEPPLTTVRLPGYELGRLAAELLVARIEGGNAGAASVMLSPELIERGSTRPYRGR